MINCARHDEEQRDPRAGRKAMNVSTANPPSGMGRECWPSTLQLAAEEVFELMLSCTLTLPSQLPVEEALDLTAMVGLAGMWSGIVTLRCQSKIAARMASRMLGTEAGTGPEMFDAVGEICNMVAGNFKNKISGLGDGCMLSVPTVISGADYNLRTLVNDEIRIVLLFEGEPVVFSLEVHN